uniref:BTB domain-containing protein n=1 Tax=Panagrolaimus sp. ES5 TaxID=591445 RepID=A0AC34F5S4_9BILA
MDILTDMAQARYDIFEKQDVEEASFDITFKFADQQILKSHKFMLTSLSETFKTMLSENWNKTGIIDIKLNSFEEFKELLKFCYLGYSAITKENVDLLLELSHCYNIPLLTKVCIHFIDKNEIINHENVVAYFNMAEGYEFEELQEIIAAFLKNVSVIFLKSDTFLDARKEFVIYLLGLNRIAAEESDLFKAVYAQELSRTNRLDTPRSSYSAASRIEKYIEITDINLKKIAAPFLYFDNQLVYNIDRTSTSGQSVRLSNGSYWKAVKFEKPKNIQIRDPGFSYFLVIDRDSDLSIKESNLESGDFVIAQFKQCPGFSCGEGCRIKCIRK